MSAPVAVCSRVLQFRAGPNEHEFFACAEHRAQLERGDVSDFFATADHAVKDVNPDDDESCYFCQEG